MSYLRSASLQLLDPSTGLAFAMRFAGTVSGVAITALAPENGTGAGRLVVTAGGNVAWQAPGSDTPGAPVAFTADGTAVLEDGESKDKWVAVQVYTDYLPESGDGMVYIQDAYSDFTLTDVLAANALAGNISTQQVYLYNFSPGPGPARAIKLWLDAATSGLTISTDGITFVTPTSESHPDVLTWSSIPFNDYVTVYVKRTIAAGAPSDPGVLNIIHFSWNGL